MEERTEIFFTFYKWYPIIHIVRPSYTKVPEKKGPDD